MAQQDPLIGHALGGARVQQRVSKGLLANVYRGHYERLGIPVAIKVLSPRAMAQGMNRERFMREGRALAQLSHPNIIKIYNVGHEAGRFFIIMDWIQDGMNLRQLAQTRPLTPAQSLKVVKRLSEALDYIHQRELIHRDLKPANVCLRRGGHPVLMDFSLIKDQKADVQLTAPGTIMGTVNFMPPEQAQPGGTFGDVSPRSDVYSLGGTLYWLLTGKPPFKGRTPMETIIKLMREQPKPPSVHNPSLPQVVDDLVLRTLSKTQDGRPASARDLINQIEQIFQTHMGLLTASQRPALADDGSGRQPRPQAKPKPPAQPQAQPQRPSERPGAIPAPQPQWGSQPALAQPAGAAQPVAAQLVAPPAPDPGPTDTEPDLPVIQEEADGGGAYQPAMSTEQASAGLLKLPEEFQQESQGGRRRVLVYVLLMIVLLAGISVAAWFLFLGKA